MRQIDGLSDPAPKHASCVNRSPVSGSTTIDAGQVRPGMTVRTCAPVTGSISMIAPVKKFPVVAPRVA